MYCNLLNEINKLWHYNKKQNRKKEMSFTFGAHEPKKSHAKNINNLLEELFIVCYVSDSNIL